MGTIRNCGVKQLVLNSKLRRLEFGGSKRPFFVFLILIWFILFIATSFCNLSFYFTQAELPGVARGILKIELKQKTYISFSLCHPQDYPWVSSLKFFYFLLGGGGRPCFISNGGIFGEGGIVGRPWKNCSEVHFFFWIDIYENKENQNIQHKLVLSFRPLSGISKMI